ncbi:MAG: T9SS type A sorting domain-containing protein [Sphingomonadales bacterium]|nr:T9SS type A sorting domain-containing protein [Sphingomonadales bacterium]
MKTILFILLLLPLFSFAQDWPIMGTPDWPSYQTKDLNDTCDVIPLGVDFGLCAMALGWALTDSGCVVLSGCSWIGSDGINYQSSFFSSSYECNSACIQDTIIFLSCIDTNMIDLGVFCPGVIDPVCGCDSVTYQNACQATYYYGVSSYYPGACVTNKVQNLNAEQISVYPNPNNGSFTLDRLPIGRTIQIVNVIGQVVYETINNTNSVFIDITSVTKGLYLLTIDRQFGQKIRIE